MEEVGVAITQDVSDLFSLENGIYGKREPVLKQQKQALFCAIS